MSIRLPGGLYTTVAECAVIAFAQKAIVAAYRSAGLIPPQELEPLLTAYRQAAIEANEALSARSELSGTKPVPMFGRTGSAAGSSWVTVQVAAKVLKISERAVVKAISKDRLIGRRVEGGGRWEVASASVERYQPRRPHQIRQEQAS